MITLTERAAAKAKALLEREGRPAAALRLRVTAGGCSGLRYELAFDEVRRRALRARVTLAERGKETP